MMPSSLILQAEIRGLASGVRGLSLAVPKRPAGPYAQFVAEEYGKVKKMHPALTAPAIMKLLGQNWAKAPQWQKNTLLAKYEEEKKKYDKVMDQLPEETVEKLLLEKQSKKIAATALELKKLLKSLEKPKRPLSSYFLFAEEQRTKIPSGTPATEVARRLAQEWSSLPAAKKLAFEEKNKTLLAEYQRAMKRWEAKMEKEGKMEQVNILRERLSSLKNPASKDPLDNKPKRSPSAFLLFQGECLKVPAIASLPGGERRKEVSARWQKLTEGKRLPYEQRAAEARADYEKALKRWTRKMEKLGVEL